MENPYRVIADRGKNRLYVDLYLAEIERPNNVWNDSDYIHILKYNQISKSEIRSRVITALPILLSTLLIFAIDHRFLRL